MSGVLVVAETRQGELREVSLELITAAGAIAGDAGGLKVAVIAGDPDAHAEALAAEGVDEVLTVRTPTAHFEAHAAGQALEALIEAEQPSVVVLGHSVDSFGFAPAVAARGGHGFASDALSLAWEDGRPVVRRGAFADHLVAELEFPGKDVVVVLMRAGAFEPAAGADGAPARAVEVDFDESAIASEHVEFREADVGDVDITTAEFLLSIGRGIEDKEAIEQFEGLADAMGATLSVSRPLVDAGWMPSARQVGQSGKTVKPKVYLALGISGAVQHLAGMRGADTIIAVNTDPEAPIFSVAHYGAVADLFEVAEELEQHF